MTFRKELEIILKDPALSAELRNELNALAPARINYWTFLSRNNDE
ncbi:Uncharacterised protein [Raoultella terrigena]|uniref:Uncharacterized protein n=1 Tax=Raoultella terrigena TaxID=577 RepID=A0A3P8JT78_RAOTE|nr:Uncharacterised protein [Raoultella terrigena]